MCSASIATGWLVTVPAQFSTQDGAQRVGTKRGQLELGQFQAGIVSRFLRLLSKDEHKGILFVWHWLSDLCIILIPRLREVCGELCR